MTEAVTGEEADAENTNLILDLLLDLRKHKKPPWVVFCLHYLFCNYVLVHDISILVWWYEKMTSLPMED